MHIDVDAHRAGIRRAIRLLFASGMQPKPVPGVTLEQQGTEMREAWLLLLGPKVSGPGQYFELARAYANDLTAADPQYGQKWPTPAVLQTYLPGARPSRDLVREFDWLANLARIQAYQTADPNGPGLITVSAESQVERHLRAKYGAEMPPDVAAGLRELGGFAGLRARLRLERDTPYERRTFVEAAMASRSALQQSPTPITHFLTVGGPRA